MQVLLDKLFSFLSQWDVVKSYAFINQYYQGSHHYFMFLAMLLLEVDVSDSAWCVVRLKILLCLGKIQLPATSDWWTCILKQADLWQVYSSDLESNSFLPLLFSLVLTIISPVSSLNEEGKIFFCIFRPLCVHSTRVEFCSCFGVLHDFKMALQNDIATVWTSSLDFDETELLHLQLKLREAE